MAISAVQTRNVEAPKTWLDITCALAERPHTRDTGPARTGAGAFESQGFISRRNARAQCRNLVAEKHREYPLHFAFPYTIRSGAQPEGPQSWGHQTHGGACVQRSCEWEGDAAFASADPSPLLQVQARGLTYTIGFGTRCGCS